MRIAFDASTAAFEKRTGTGVYAQQLILSYQNRFSEEDEVIQTYRLSRWIRGHKYLLALSKNSKRAVIQDPFTAFKGYSYDIFHGLNSRLPLMVGAKKIATVHDLFSLYGKFTSQKFHEDQKTKLMNMISRADHIICPATFTKDQLVHNLGLSHEKISVVGLGVQDLFLKNTETGVSAQHVRDKFNLSKPYLFFVGALEKRKNVKGLVEAFAILHQRQKRDLDLVLVGHPAFGYEEIENAIATSGVSEKIKNLGFVKDEDLRHLYTACTAFVFLSHEEGFGIPVIEAMACGAPVISSSTTSLPEVSNGQSWLVSPDDSTQIISALETVLQKLPSVMEKIEVGRRYAQDLTWTKVAEKTREVYRKAIGGF